MPIYEYTCSKCQHVFEEWVRSASSAETENFPCPKCGAESFRILSNTSFALKGEGWFNTCYPNTKGTKSGANSTNSDKQNAADSKTDNTSTASTADSKKSPANQ